MTVLHVRLKEWETVGPDVEPLRGASLDKETDRELARNLARLGILEVSELRTGLRVRAQAHVGRVQLGNLVVTIEPKIGSTELLDLVRYAYGLRELKLYERTAFAHTGDLLQDLLASQLLAEVTELSNRGLFKRYVEHAEDLASPRGRIAFATLARRAEPTSASLPCRHHLRSPNHHLNGTVRAGVRLAASLAQDPDLRRALLRLDAVLGAETGEVALTREALDKAVRQLNRQTVAYGSALQITELLFDNTAVSLGAGGVTQLRGFLFDMNRFFQALVGRFLSENLEGFTVAEERTLKTMMHFVEGKNPNHRRAPSPRPDFSIMSGRKVERLLDAKYRDLWARELPRDMLYQLAIYAMSQPRGATAAILFPTTSSGARSAVVAISDPVTGGAMAFVELRPIQVQGLLCALREGLGARARLATRWAFGDS